MNTPHVLVIWSDYYEALARLQLDGCLRLLENAGFACETEQVRAGIYEIPSVIHLYHAQKPFDAYISLGLLLQGATDHYAFIRDHLRSSFTRFATEGIIVGDGNIYAPSMQLLEERVMQQERVKEAFSAVDYLLGLQKRLASAAP